MAGKEFDNHGVFVRPDFTRDVKYTSEGTRIPVEVHYKKDEDLREFTDHMEKAHGIRFSHEKESGTRGKAFGTSKWNSPWNPSGKMIPKHGMRPELN